MIKLNNLINQFLKQFVLIGYFKSDNIIWESKIMNKRSQTLKRKITNSNNLCLHNEKSQTHLDPFSDTFFAINLTVSDPSIFKEYNWRVYQDCYGIDHYSIIMESTKTESSEYQTILKPPQLNFQKNKLAII